MFHFKCENNKKEKKGRQSKNKAEIPKENKAPEFQPFFFCFGLQPDLLHLSNCTSPIDTNWPHSWPSRQKGEGPSEPWRLK